MSDATPPDGSRFLDQCVEGFVERYKGKGVPSISTGLTELDRAIIGLKGKKMYVLAGRPGMGKSALSTTIRRSVIAQGYAVAEFNLEMGRDEICERELAQKADIDLRRILQATSATQYEVDRAISVFGTHPKDRWFVYDDKFSIEVIREAALELKEYLEAKGIKLGLIIIDYLQLLGDDGKDRQQSVSKFSRMTKLLSKELDCAILALSQLNRGCEYRDDKRPIMADIRESGSIEQDADLIMFVYRDWVYNPSSSPTDAELIIRKQRAGPTGTVHVSFNPKQVYFHDRPPTEPGPDSEP